MRNPAPDVAPYEAATAPQPLPVLAALFRQFAAAECGQEPLYAALCGAAAADDETLCLLWAAPREQQRPNLLLAAVHDTLLAGADHPLRDYFPSLEGTRNADAELPRHFADFRSVHRDALLERIRQRTTQTNEIGRCAVLWPALKSIAGRFGRARLALIDIGCSAGLNLGVDRYQYDYGDPAPAPRTGSVTIQCRMVGAARPRLDAPLEIVERIGIDPAPLDVNDQAAVRWLRACIWPHDHARAARFERAVALAQKERWPVRREEDCTQAAAAIVAALPAEVLPVLFNSWVLTYFEPAALERHQRAMELLARRGAAWLSAEGPSLRLGGAEWPTPVEDTLEQREGTRWTLCALDDGRLRYTPVACSHPHGKWMQWLDAASSTP